jgi:hypothetical protein
MDTEVTQLRLHEYANCQDATNFFCYVTAFLLSDSDPSIKIDRVSQGLKSPKCNFTDVENIEDYLSVSDARRPDVTIKLIHSQLQFTNQI